MNRSVGWLRFIRCVREGFREHLLFSVLRCGSAHSIFYSTNVFDCEYILSGDSRHMC